MSHRGLLHGGVDAMAAQTGGRFSELGVETIEPIVRPGVLLDVAGALGLRPALPAVEISPEAPGARRRARGVELAPGSVVLIHTGWGRHFDDKERFVGLESGVPGPGEAGARWLAAASPFAVGSDTIAFEHIAPGAGHRLLPATVCFSSSRGSTSSRRSTWTRSWRARLWSFTFVCLPLKLVGATGSPVRPVAIGALNRPR